MRILILGPNGMLGKEFINTLLKYHMDIVLGETIDITSKISCKEISKIDPDVVINCAAYTNVDGCESDPEKCFNVNGLALQNLTEACERAKIVHFSSDYVFDGLSETPYDEESKTNPINTYGVSKLIGEKYLINNSKNYLLIRTSWLYGGEFESNFVTSILKAARSQTEPLKVVNDQIGSPTYTKDLVYAVRKCLDLNQTGVFNITNSNYCSWYEFAKTIIKLAKVDAKVLPITSNQLDRPAKRPHNSVLSCSKYNSRYGILRSWNIALEEYLYDILLIR